MIPMKKQKIMVMEEMEMEITQMAMATGMAPLLMEVVKAAEVESLKHGVQSTKNPSIAIIQKDFLKNPIVGVKKK